MRRFSILCVLCLSLAAALASSAAANAAVLIGDQTIESTLDSTSAGSAEAFPFSQATAGTASSISVYVDSQNTAGTLTAGLYSDSSGQPGALLASGSLAPKAGTWNTVSIASTAISAGQTYWVAVLGNSGTVYFRDRNGGPCDSVNSYQTNLTSLPSSWASSVQWNTCPISAYVNGTGAATAAPVNTALPAVSGTATQGQTLSTSNGTWSNAPTSYAYQWQDCNGSGASCANVSGATSSSYTLTSGDVGHTMRAVVTATNAGGSTPAASAQTAMVAAPPQSTSVLFGDQNAASYADSNADGVAQAFSYTAAASGTTGDIHLYVNTGTTATKLFVGVYADSGGKPGSLLASGSISSPQAGAWNDVSVTSATITQGSTYWIALLGTGGQLNYLDTGNGSGASYVDSSTSLSSLPATYASGNEWNVSPASAYLSGALSTGGGDSGSTAPNNTALPTVSGTTTAGQTLTTTNGSWSGSPTSYAYQWQDCDSTGANCTNISGVSGANSSSYTLTSGDISHTTRAVVTASNAAGSTSATSGQTNVVAAVPPAAPSNTAVPTISGTTTQGQTLTTSNGTWTNSPTSYGYQWQDCDSSGASCANISGATSSSYTLQSSDVGHTLNVTVTASNSGGSARATSSSVGPVSAQQQGQNTNCLPSAGQTMTNTVSHLCGFADTTNTGVPAGTTLYRVPQDITAPTAQTGYGWSWDPRGWVVLNAGGLINNVQVDTQIVVMGGNSTIQNSEIIQSSHDFAIKVQASNVTIENNSIHGLTQGGNTWCGVGIQDVYGNAENLTIENNNLWWCSNPLNNIANGGLIQNNYAHDMAISNTGSHYEDIQFEPGSGLLMTFRNNTFLNDHTDQTAAIILSNDGGGTESNRLIDHNLMSGGGYTFYGAGCSSCGATNIKFTNNHFSPVLSPQWGPDVYWQSGQAGNVWSGNVWDNTGATWSP